nr:4Fe-4S cluster-binding domain-containing protein [Candidatus Sigynarchaeota archaeon]
MHDLLKTLRSIQAPGTPKNLAIVKSIDAGMDLDEIEALAPCDLDKVHERLHAEFLNRKKVPPKVYARSLSYLDVKIALARRMLRACEFCEVACGVNRTEGEKGSCRVSDGAHVGSAFLHYGEEQRIIPSGTIFFAGCNFKCVFCQNNDLSTDPGAGEAVDALKLAHVAGVLSKEGAKNINYVGGDPTPDLHVILESMKYQDNPVAQLWNSNFYNGHRAVGLLLDAIDIWLPDFKFGNDTCAKRLSGIDNYWNVLTRNLKRVHDDMVAPGWASLVIRHLVLPNHVECCSKPILTWISENLPCAMVNIMGQYRPHHLVL